MKSTQEEEIRIDSVKMKREIQRQIEAETRGMSPKERLAYYRRLAESSPFKPKRLKRTRLKAGRSEP